MKKRHIQITKLARTLLKQKSASYGKNNIYKLRAELNELASYKMELELQNNELKRVQQEMLQNKSELETSQKKYFELFEFAPIGYVIFNLDYQIIDANFISSEYFGLSKDELILKKIINFIHPESLDTFHFHIRKLLKNGRKQDAVIKVKNQAGDVYHARIESQHTDEHEIQMAIVDIRELEEEKEKAKQREEKYRLLADNTSDVISTLDKDNRFTYYSPSVEDLRGYTPQQAMQQSLEETLSPDSLKNIQVLMNDVTSILKSKEKSQKDLECVSNKLAKVARLCGQKWLSILCTLNMVS